MRKWHGGALAVTVRALLFIALGMAGIPAHAAGLSGECCADLEERIAELEASVVRSGVRQQKSRNGKNGNGDMPGVVTEPPGETETGGNGGLVLSGTVNRALLIWDDGRDLDVYNVDGAGDGSEIKLERSYDIGHSWSAGFTIAIDILNVPSDTVDQVNATGDGSVIELSESYLEFSKNGTLGTLKLGFADTAADEVDNINLTRADAAGDAGVQDWNANFLLRFSGSDDLGPPRWEDFITGAIGGETFGIIRYSSPTRYGFTVDAAWGADDYWDAALRYSRVWANTLWTKGAIGYWNNRNEDVGAAEPTEDEGWGGSFALRHIPSGLNIAFNYGTESHTDNCADPGAVTDRCRGDDRFYYVRGGIVRNNFTPLGFTSVFGEYYRGQRDFNESDTAVLAALEQLGGTAEELSQSEATVWGVGVVQQIKSVAAEVYLAYRHYELDVDLVRDGGGSVDSVAAREIEDFDAVLAGAKIEF